MADANLPEIPEHFADLDDEALAALGVAIREAAAPYEEAARAGDPDAVSAVTQLADAFQKVTAETGEREATKRDQATRAQSALEILGTTAEPSEPSEPPAGEAATVAGTATLNIDPVVDVDKLGEQIATAAAKAAETLAATTVTQEATVEPPTSETALDLGAPVGAANAALAAVSDAVTTTTTAPPMAAPAAFSTLTMGDALLPAQPRRLRTPRQRVHRDAEPVRLVDTGTVSDADLDKELDKGTLARQMARKFDQVKGHKLRPAGEGKLYLAHAQLPNFSFELGNDKFANTEILRGVQSEWQADMTAVVASGGNCAIPTNNYDVFNAAEEQSPVEGFLRGVGADRGGMRYLSAPDWTSAQSGVQVTTEAEDTARYTNQTPAGSTTPKVCVHFSCPSELECVVDAVSACASFGNLTYRTAPELVEVLLDQLAVAHAQAKEITYLDAIQAGSTDVNYVGVYGAFRTAVYALAVAAQGYRKRNHIGRTMPLDVLAPDSIIPVLKADMVADHALGANFVSVDQETLVAELFAALNLNVEFYYDYSTTYGAARAMQDAQAAGDLNGPPTDFRVYMYAPGTWVRLDGGTLDVGLVRDSTLNSQNDLQLFSEEWTQACQVGFESVRLDLTLCASGVGPSSGTALTCTS